MTKVTFNLRNNTILLVYKCPKTGSNLEFTSPLTIQSTSNWKSAVFEYHHVQGPWMDGGEHFDTECKWIFRWKQYGKKEQVCTLDQYLPWQMSSFPQPRHYKPWTSLACWSYIAEPAKGTLQTNKIYKNYYHSDQITQIKSLAFEIIGMEDEKYNWNTDDSSENGYY